MNEIKKAVILCGGLGTRFLPISKSVPKEMLPVYNKPILQIIVEELKEAGIEECLIILGKDKECIMTHFSKKIDLEERLMRDHKDKWAKACAEPNELMNIFYVRQQTANGTGGAVKIAKSFVNNHPFIMVYGDEIYYTEKGNNRAQQLIKNYNKYGENVMAVQAIDLKDSYKYGMIKYEVVDKDVYKVDDLVEKPKPEDAPSNMSNLGSAIFKAEVFDELEKCEEKNGEILLTDALVLLAKQNKLLAQNITAIRQDLGSPFGLIKANIDYCLLGEDREELLKHIKNILEKNN